MLEPSKPKRQKVDINKLLRLTEMKKTYQVSKKVTRITFSILCGCLFHLLFFAYDIHFLNLTTFSVIAVLQYLLMDLYEEYEFTRPIEVSVTTPSCFSVRQGVSCV